MPSGKGKYEDFMSKINHAEKILDIIELRELSTPLSKLRKKFLLLQELRLIPRMRSLVEQTIDIALPLLLVFSVSCLEHFLSTCVRKKKLYKMIDDCEFKVGKRLTRKIHQIRIKRNIIIHSPEQRTEKRNLNDFILHQITGYKLNQILKLTPEDVKSDLNTLRKFAEQIALS